MERYHDFQIKDHYYWVETPKVEAKPAPTSEPTKRERSIRVIEADGTIASHAAYQRSKPVIIDGYMI